MAELFEVRKPKDMAVVSEIAGIVEYAGESKGKRKLIVRPELGDPKEYLVPKGKHITASDGDYVDAGDLLTKAIPNCTTSCAPGAKNISPVIWWMKSRKCIASRAWPSTTNTSKSSSARC